MWWGCQEQSPHFIQDFPAGIMFRILVVQIILLVIMKLLLQAVHVFWGLQLSMEFPYMDLHIARVQKSKSSFVFWFPGHFSHNSYMPTQYAHSRNIPSKHGEFVISFLHCGCALQPTSDHYSQWFLLYRSSQNNPHCTSICAL